jgi:hypothetical protein
MKPASEDNHIRLSQFSLHKINSIVCVSVFMSFGSSWNLTHSNDRPGHERWYKQSIGKNTGVSSAFSRRKIVEGGLVHNACASLSLSVPDGRLWVFSSVKSWSRAMDPVSVVAFERGSTTEVIEESAFGSSGLKSIMIPSSVVVLGNSCFRQCWSLESVTFENGSRL